MTRNKIFSTISKILITFVILLALEGVPALVSAEAPPHNVTVLFLIDDSGSMADNDRLALRYTAIRLFVSALDEGDQVGVIRFASQSSLLLPVLTTIDNAQTKSDIIESIQPIVPEGYTNVLDAFSMAEAILRDSDTDHSRTVVILLTDGKPEIEKPYAAYEREAIEKAVGLGVPIYTVALTPYSQTSFLNQLTGETGGKVFPARTADNLFDSYLQIFGELKDRTVVKNHQLEDDGSVDIWLSPNLVPYIQKVTFIASQSDYDDIQLIAPDGSPVNDDNAKISFRFLSDAHFVAITVEHPPGGKWTFQFLDSTPVQVHAILHSRLRVRLHPPGGLHPQGSPMLISASMYEELSDGQVSKVIGEASFMAEIKLPDGTSESIDALYDDGTHGDLIAGDGHYSRIYSNPTIEGLYQISVTGVKGLVPIQASTQVEVIPFPTFAVEQPKNQEYAIRSKPIPLKVVLQGDYQTEFLEGGMDAFVTAPSGKTDRIPLTREDKYFSGTYLPKENSAYKINYIPRDLVYRGIEVSETIQANFNSRIIGKLVIQDAKVGIGPTDDPVIIEIPQPGDLIPVMINVESHSHQMTTLMGHLENMPGINIHNNVPIEVPPNSPYQKTIYLETSTKLQPGTWDGFLIFAATDDVDLVNDQVPLVIEFITPILVIERAMISTTASCSLQQTYSVMLTFHSSSLSDETLPVKLGWLGAQEQEISTLTVSPGTQEFHFEMNARSSFMKYEENIEMLVGPARPELLITPHQEQIIAITIPGIWQTCRRPIIFLGLGLLVAGMITASMAKKLHQRSKPPVVCGTLIHWLAATAQIEYQVNLTGLDKTEVKIGKDRNCDVVLPYESVASEHLAILAELGDTDEVRLAILPNEPVLRGYQTYTSPLPLEEHTIYQVGDCQFKYIADLEF